MGDMQFNGTPEEWDALVKKNREITMTQQKLYTEEQVREILKSTHIHTDNDVDMILPQFTPIKLPSDEEIYFESRRYEKYHESMNELESERSAARYHGHMQGAKYVINKILNK